MDSPQAEVDLEVARNGTDQWPGRVEGDLELGISRRMPHSTGFSVTCESVGPSSPLERSCKIWLIPLKAFVLEASLKGLASSSDLGASVKWPRGMSLRFLLEQIQEEKAVLKVLPSLCEGDSINTCVV